MKAKFKMKHDVITGLSDLNEGEIVEFYQAAYGRDMDELLFVLCQSGQIHVIGFDDVEVIV
jgi:hypothetical protein